jgi:hypothetical protein
LYLFLIPATMTIFSFVLFSRTCIISYHILSTETTCQLTDSLTYYSVNEMKACSSYCSLRVR